MGMSLVRRIRRRGKRKEKPSSCDCFRLVWRCDLYCTVIGQRFLYRQVGYLRMDIRSLTLDIGDVILLSDTPLP